MTAAECGTDGGYQAHRRKGEAACGPCRTARRDYMREFRASRADVRANENRRARARLAALTELGRRYPDEYDRLVLEALQGDRR